MNRIIFDIIITAQFLDFVGTSHFPGILKAASILINESTVLS
jgi:hypothetical protein